MKSKSTFIMIKEELEQNDYESINRLRDICNEKDPTSFKLELD